VSIAIATLDGVDFPCEDDINWQFSLSLAPPVGETDLFIFGIKCTFSDRERDQNAVSRDRTLMLGF
jgi:hypothetical protein